jgi:hypothetical protein
MDDPPPHIDGRAGRGKTYLLYPVIGALRKRDEIVLLSASSAFAAKNYPGRRTTHYLYGIPVDEYKPFLKSSVGPRSDRAQLLHAAKCHVIDEIGGLHFKAFDCSTFEIFCSCALYALSVCAHLFCLHCALNPLRNSQALRRSLPVNSDLYLGLNQPSSTNSCFPHVIPQHPRVL